MRVHDTTFRHRSPGAYVAATDLYGGQGSAQLVDYLGDDDRVVDAARVSHDKRADEYPPERNDGLLDYLVEHRHTSPTEHVYYTFRIDAPVVAWWHLLRHRVASYNLTSGRYVEYSDRVYRPAEWRGQDTKNRQGSAGTADVPDALVSALAAHERESMRLYKELLECGVAREQARGPTLPAFHLMQTGWCTVNLHSLANMVRLRCAPEAQAEVREVVTAMRALAAVVHPKLADRMLALPGANS